MSISYNCIIGHKQKVTLPSVSGGLGSMYIQKNPPSSIHTRRISKVGETSSLTSLIDDSGDRINEAILNYARGVNPMVSVSYGNQGNGTMNGNVTSNSAKPMASMPNRIMDKGDFRPPIYDRRELLPLSRLPRTTTSSFTQPSFVDYSKSKAEGVTSDKTIGIKKEMLNKEIQPTRVYNIQPSAIEPYEIKYIIQNPLRISAKSGVRTMDLTNTENQKPYNNILTSPIQIDFNINKNINNNSKAHVFDMDTGRYLQDTLHSDVRSNMNRNKNTNEVTMDTNRYLQDPLHSDVRSNMNRNKEMNEVTMDTGRYLQDTLHSDVRSNMNRNKEMNEVTMDTNRYLQDTLHSDVRSNMNRNKEMNEVTMDTSRYLQDTLHSDVRSNMNGNKKQNNTNEMINFHVGVKDINNINYNTSKSGYEKNEYIHRDIELSRKIPEGDMTTNIRYNVYNNQDTDNMYIPEYKRNIPLTSAITNIGFNNIENKEFEINREYNLKPTLILGGMESKGVVPKQNMNDFFKEHSENPKDIMRQKVYDMQVGRVKNPPLYN